MSALLIQLENYLEKYTQHLRERTRNFRLKVSTFEFGHKIERGIQEMKETMCRESMQISLNSASKKSLVIEVYSDPKLYNRYMASVFKNEDLHDLFVREFKGDSDYIYLEAGFSSLHNLFLGIVQQCKTKEMMDGIDKIVPDIFAICSEVEPAIYEGLHVMTLERGKTLSHNLLHEVSRTRKEIGARIYIAKGVSERSRAFDFREMQPIG